MPSITYWYTYKKCRQNSTPFTSSIKILMWLAPWAAVMYCFVVSMCFVSARCTKLLMIVTKLLMWFVIYEIKAVSKWLKRNYIICDVQLWRIAKFVVDVFKDIPNISNVLHVLQLPIWNVSHYQLMNRIISWMLVLHGCVLVAFKLCFPLIGLKKMTCS